MVYGMKKFISQCKFNSQHLEVLIWIRTYYFKFIFCLRRGRKDRFDLEIINRTTRREQEGRREREREKNRDRRVGLVRIT